MTYSPAEAMSDEDADAMLAAAFPNGFPAKGRAAKPANSIMGVTPLGVDDVAALAAHIESGQSLGVVPSPVKAIRPSHHRLARLLAMGLDEGKAALLSNYSPARVAILKSDPAFQELMAGYAGDVTEAWADTVEVLANLSMDSLQELQLRLDEKPESFNNEQLMGLAKLTLDRTGNGPTSTQNVNAKVVHMTPADIERIKNGSSTPGTNGDGSGAVRPLTADHRRALAGSAGDAPAASGQVEGVQFLLPFGEEVREAGPEVPPGA